MDRIFLYQLFQNPAYFFIVSLVVLFSICLHEYFHALAALLLGDDTAAQNGHLTLNPLKQMGVWSLIIFLLLGFAWGAVPVDNERLREKGRWAPSVVSLAGPFANLILAIVGWTVFGLVWVRDVELNKYMLGFIFIFGEMNLVLLIFNLIPIPGLDGWNAVMSWFPNRKIFSSETMKGVLLFIVLISFFCVKYIFQFAQYVMEQAPVAFSSFAVPISVFDVH